MFHGHHQSITLLLRDYCLTVFLVIYVHWPPYFSLPYTSLLSEYEIINQRTIYQNWKFITLKPVIDHQHLAVVEQKENIIYIEKVTTYGNYKAWKYLFTRGVKFPYLFLLIFYSTLYPQWVAHANIVMLRLLLSFFFSFWNRVTQ